MKVVTDLSVASARHRAPLPWQPTQLFRAGEKGAILFPSPETCFTDLAGTIPATPGDPVALLRDESGNGYDAAQDIVSSRPTLIKTPATGARNLHPFSQSDTGFIAVGVTPPVVVNGATHLNEKCVSVTFDENMGAGFANCRAERSYTASIESGRLYTSSFHVSLSRALTGSEQIVLYFTGVSGMGQIALNAANTAALVGAFSRLSISVSAAASGGVSIRPFLQSAVSSPVTLHFNRTQLEQGALATAYQETQTLFDVTEIGVPSLFGLHFDGTDDSLHTAMLDLAAPRAVSIFAGARKLSDDAIDVLIEHGSNNVSTNGSFVLQATGVMPDKAVFASRGTARAAAVGTYGTAPESAVLSGLGVIGPGFTAMLRVNGSLVASSNIDQGSGDYEDHALHIGHRSGSTMAFHGCFFGAIVRFASSTPEEITTAEALLAKRTGVNL